MGSPRRRTDCIYMCIYMPTRVSSVKIHMRTCHVNTAIIFGVASLYSLAWIQIYLPAVEVWGGASAPSEAHRCIGSLCVLSGPLISSFAGLSGLHKAKPVPKTRRNSDNAHAGARHAARRMCEVTVRNRLQECNLAAHAPPPFRAAVTPTAPGPEWYFPARPAQSLSRR